MRILAAEEQLMMDVDNDCTNDHHRLEVPLMFHAHSMLSSPSQRGATFSPCDVIVVSTSGQQRPHRLSSSSCCRPFVFAKAVELVVGNTYVDGKDGSMIPSRQSMDDVIMCSAAIIYNMALFYHLKFRREEREEHEEGSLSEDDMHKAEQLYLLCLQVIEPFGVAMTTTGLSALDGHLRNVYLLLRIGSLNNLGSIMATSRRPVEACQCYAGLMELLNVLEDEYRSASGEGLDREFRTDMVDESEWSAMTNSCLAVLFNVIVGTKTALAA
jgi:hypothetical protein